MAGGPLRVTFVLPSLEQGGMERVILRLAAGFAADDRFAPSLVVLDGHGPLRSAVDARLPLHDLGRPRLRSGFRALAGHLRRERPDVVVASIVHLNLGLLLIRLGPRHRWRLVIRDASSAGMLDELPTTRVYRAGVRALYRRADVVVASSPSMAAGLRAVGVPASRVRVVPNPVDVDALRRAASPPQREPGPGRRFVALGRLDPVKGLERLPVLLTGLAPEDRIRVIGEGAERAALEALAQRLGVADRFSLPGWDDEPAAWLAGADALLLPSRHEGMPNAALEALACGTPVIGSGTIAALGDLAVAGAPVTSVHDDEGLRRACLDIRPLGPPEAPRPSSLPHGYEVRGATATFAAAVLAAAPRPTQGPGLGSAP